MNHGTNYAVQALRGAGAIVRQVGADIARGALVTARLGLTTVGALALFGAAFLVSDGEVRSRIAAAAPSMVEAIWPALAAKSEAASTGAALAEAPAGNETVANPPALAADAQPQQNNVARYLARRYRVAEEAVRWMVATAFESGRALDLDPTLILAVVAVESSMNPFAQSEAGAQGLMQVVTNVHADKFALHGGKLSALDPVANIRVGSAILKDMITRGGSVERGLQLYVGAGNLADDGGYAERVLGERSRIQMASTGRTAPAANPVAPVGASVPVAAMNLPSAAGMGGV